MVPREPNTTTLHPACLHCGLPVRDRSVDADRAFCCEGCRVVYDLLHERGLHPYYTIAASPGRTASLARDGRYAYLDDPETISGIREFSDGSTSAVTLQIPGMHCAACIWLLEQLHSLDSGILHSRVDFLKKTIRIRYSEALTSLRSVVELLASLGYEPLLTLDTLAAPAPGHDPRPLYYRIGVAGFCFGNIMLLSFPEYLGGSTVEPELRTIFRWLSLLLALPVAFYSASDYFRSATASLRKRIVNLDVPLALGIGILFLRSLYEIAVGVGPGYLDSMSGLVLFLLIGRVFQNISYDRLNFERNYRSYFPLAIHRLGPGAPGTVSVAKLAPGDRILLRNGEISPADAVVMTGGAAIDYGFVTGESRPVDLPAGSVLHAGGRQTGGAIEAEVIAPVSESYLARLWSDVPGSGNAAAPYSAIATAAGKYFTAGVLFLAAVAALLWMPVDPPRAWNAITAILIVACPCAIALAVPFSFGTALRILGTQGFFLKNTGVVETLARINTIVLDKTGTITRPGSSTVAFVGDPLSREEERLLRSLVRNSHHPLSRAIESLLGPGPADALADFVEVPGRGIAGTVDGRAIRLGSSSFALEGSEEPVPQPRVSDTQVFCSFGGTPRGYFSMQNVYREGIEGLARRLTSRFRLHLLSGDSSGERPRLAQIFGKDVPLLFHQSPADKREFVRALRQQGARVAMIGDGLNDGAALSASQAGIAVTEDIAAFSPACDAILDARELHRLDVFLGFAATSVRIVMAAFGISILYNIIGLVYAFSGTLSPLVAAVLMPASSVSVVAFTTLAVRAAARRKGLRP